MWVSACETLSHNVPILCLLYLGDTENVQEEKLDKGKSAIAVIVGLDHFSVIVCIQTKWSYLFWLQNNMASSFKF